MNGLIRSVFWRTDRLTRCCAEESTLVDVLGYRLAIRWREASFVIGEDDMMLCMGPGVGSASVAFQIVLE